MAKKLVVIRGNSGSGKTTTAQLLREKMGDKVMLLSQDVLRRKILKSRDTAGNPTIELIRQMALYGSNQGYDVIIEGILTEERYGDMLRKLMKEFKPALVYYLNIPFKETMKRHLGRPKAEEFGEAEMREWWREEDVLKVEGERIFDHTLSAAEIADKILADIDDASE